MRAPFKILSTISQLAGPLSRPDNEIVQRVYREQQKLMISQSLTMGLVNIFNGLIAAVLFLGFTANWQILLWYAPILAFGLLQIRMWQRLNARTLPSRVTGRFLVRVENTALVVGVIWGMAIFALPSGDSVSKLLTLVVIQCGMAAGVASLMTTLPRVVIRFSTACILITVAGLFYHGAAEAFALIAPALAYLLAVCAATLVSHGQLVESMRAQVQAERARADLHDAISSTRDAFAILDQDGNVVLANSRHKELFGETDTFTPRTDDEPRLNSDGSWVIGSSRQMTRGGTVCVHADVTALKERESELIDARREAEQADETKTRFLTAMSHELRTPLNIIIGFSRLMAAGSKIDLSAEQSGDYAKTIHASAEQLLALINDIIDYSRIGLDGYALNPDEHSIRQIIEASKAAATNIVSEGDLAQFEVSVSDHLRDLYVDESAVRRILTNLMTNAIKFGGSSRRVVVKASVSTDGRPFVSVRDFGIGMTEEDLANVFEPFFQKSAMLNREHNGAGLGLTLTRHLARLHGGDIVLKSRPGAGTSATLVLPESTFVRTASVQSLESAKKLAG